MFRNNVKVALRSLLKNKGFTFLNITGLGLGLAICLLIVFYVIDEYSYDKFNTNAARIFRVNSDIKFENATTSFAIAASPIAPALKKSFPEIENTVRLTPVVGIRFKKGDDEIPEDKGAYSDASLFDIFTLPMIEGNATTALTEPNTIVINESTAKKYFNRTDVIGQTILSVNDNIIHKITGVIRDIPTQSHFNFDFFLSMSSLPLSNNDDWLSANFNSYVLIRPGVDYKKVEVRLPAFFNAALNSVKFDEKANEESGNYYRINFTPLTDIHLQSNRQRELGVNNSIQTVYIFSAIALFILVMACINYINLSTARSFNRAREVGVRKVLGSTRIYLATQFLFESVIVAFAAILIAVLVASVLLPLFNQLSGKDLTVTKQTITWLLPSIIISILVIGVIAGSYPAFFLSAYKPVDVLKGKLSKGMTGKGLRSSLVVLQFVISIFLVTGTLVVSNQLHYIRSKDLGFNREQVVIVKNVTKLDNPEILEQEVKKLPEVANATLSSFFPTGDLRSPGTLTAKNKTSIFTEIWPVDKGYINTMGMSLVKGRNFSDQMSTDSSAIIINETAAKLMGIFKDPLNQTVYNDNNNRAYRVIGVVKDFNFNSLRDNITPVVLVLDNKNASSLSVRMKTENIPFVLGRIEKKWKELSPNQQFQYSFMNADFDAIYRAEERTGKIFGGFAILAIVIACLGLFGLTAYSAEQRNKEISIRKILGADTLKIMMLLSKDFIKLVLIAILISTPLAWLVMQRWLQDFAYRANIHWWILAIAGIGGIVVAFITISFQSIKAANANPLKNLRTE